MNYFWYLTFFMCPNVRFRGGINTPKSFCVVRDSIGEFTNSFFLDVRSDWPSIGSLLYFGKIDINYSFLTYYMQKAFIFNVTVSYVGHLYNNSNIITCTNIEKKEGQFNEGHRTFDNWSLIKLNLPNWFRRENIWHRFIYYSYIVDCCTKTGWFNKTYIQKRYI